MKKVIFSLALFLTCSLLGYAQKGISYQAVILDPKPIEIPGQDITGQPFVNGEVFLKFKLFSVTFVQEFEEVHVAKTDGYGLVNVLIGSVSPAAFASLVWDNNPRSMQVWVSFDQGGTYTKVSEQVLTYSPYSLYAETTGTAGKLSGTLTIGEGGTGAKTAANARTNLGLGNVDNTADANKPVSIATQVALDTKANANEVTTALGLKANTGDVNTALATKANAIEVTTALATKANASDVSASLGLKEDVSNKANTPLGSSTTLFPTQNAVKAYVDAQVAGATIADASSSTKGKIQLAGDLAGTAAAPTVPGLALKANASDVTTALAVKADTAYVLTKVAAATIPDASSSTKGKIQLAGDLAGTAAAPTVPGLALKANASEVTAALAAKADTAYVLTKVAAATIADASSSTKGKIQLAGDLAGTAAAPTVPGLALKADAADVTSALATKASSSDLTSGLALKANTSDMTAALALKSPLASPSFTGTVAIGTTNPSPSAVLDVTSTSKGLLLPRLTFAQKSAIVSPEPGLILWCSDCGTSGELQVYNGSNFVNMVGANAQFALPSVSSTVSATSITSSALTSGGVIDSDGGAFVTARGVVWNTSTNPTISLSTKTTDGTGIGSFSSAATGLTSGVTYYVRAYATNSVGTKYGPEISVNTAASVATLAATNDVSSIGATTATSGGNITYNGGATVTVSGLVWSTSSNPTTSDNKTTNGSANGSFTSNITGLTPGTLYYVRSYATNSLGTSYGAQTSFTTLNTASISATTSVTSITSTSATSGGTITTDGGAAVSARGIVWGTSTGASTFSVTTGFGTGTFVSNLTGLSPATTYYVRSFATNSVGTVYGTETSFTTIAVAPILETTSVSNITRYGASTGGTITSNGGSSITASGICWSTTATPTISDNKTTDGTISGTFTSSITGLTAGTTYYVRAYATNAIGTSYGTAQSFTTVATVATMTLPSVGSSYGGGKVAYVYQNGDPGYSSNNIPVLIAATSDQVQSQWSIGGQMGNAQRVGLIGSTYEALGTGLSNTNAIISAYGNGGNYAAKLARDYTDGTYTDWYLPSTNEFRKVYENRNAIGGFSADRYWVSSEIDQQGSTNTLGISFNFTNGFAGGDSKAWNLFVRPVRTTTIVPSVASTPIIAATTSAASITSSSAILGGNVTDEGATEVSARGLVYGTSTGSSTFSVTVGSGAGTFTSTLTGLAQGTTYFVRSFATNVQGTSYGAETSFTTQTTPTVSATSTPTSVTTTTAVSGGTISSTGGASITTSGLVWDVNSNPEITLATKTTDGATFGTFTSSITGLTQGTTYHVRAYATNSVGTSYGPDVTFTTLTTPTVTATATVTSITGTTATSGGTITSDGGASITTSGLVWDVNSNPEITLATKTTDGAASGTFTSSITGLTRGTTYHIRAYATNSVGTSYGPEVSFATPSLPTLTTSAITINSITGTSAVLTSQITSDGGATAIGGFQYGIGSYTNTATSNSFSGGTFSTTLTGLIPGTVYQANAFATNTAGTVYGNTPLSFTTLNYPTLSTTFAVTNISGTSAESGATIDSDGGANIISRGLVWGTSSGSSTYSITIGSGTGTFTGTLTGLSGGNTYYVRAFATNSVGTSYGAEVSFSMQIPTVTSSTGKIWMDRNLGATRVATSSDDVDSYGYLYNWGRNTDGHQERNASVTSTKATSSSPNTNLFINGYDWLNPSDNNLWQGVNGINNPCPTGFRIPTESEWAAEKATWSSANAAGAFASVLKLPYGNFRDYQRSDGLLSNDYARYWSSTTVGGNQSKAIIFDAGYVGISTQYRGNGFSVRCIKE